MPTLSIIIPVYNVAPYLRECLDSILVTNTFSEELVCVDDGSNDGSSDILAEYAKRFSNLRIITQTNQGQSAARNAGLTAVSGDYIYFVDSDDYLLPDAIKQIDELIETYHTSSIIYTDCVVEPNNQRFSNIPPSQPAIYDNAVIAYDDVWTKNGILPHASLYLYIYKSTLFKDHNLRMKIGHYYEDELQIFDIFCCPERCVLLHVETPWYYYRTNREGATTSRIKMKNLLDSIDIARTVYHKMMSRNLVTRARQTKVFQLILQTLLYGYDSQYRHQWRKYFCKNDLRIMEECAQNAHEKKLCRLARIHPMLMVAYKKNELPGLVRRTINRWM